MDVFIDFLISYGNIGMFISSFLAGSILPLSSEAVMTGLQIAGADKWQLLMWATLGNTLGSLLNYWLGHLCKKEWLLRKFSVKPERFKKSEKLVEKYGGWIGFLSWVPVLGEALTLAMGLMRTNIYISITSIFLGKFIRYLIIILAISNV
ncbi:MAG: YqaA family protein [Bacteroidaceae bacterium]